MILHQMKFQRTMNYYEFRHHILVSNCRRSSNNENNKEETGEEEQRSNKDEETENNENVEEEEGNIYNDNNEVKGNNVDEFNIDEESNTLRKMSTMIYLDDIRKRALKNVFFAINIKHKQSNTLLKSLHDHLI